MASINTNASAIGALSILRQTNADLDTTQRRISTGLKISESRDNASTFSIAQGLRSDIQTTQTIRDAIGLGQSTLGIAVAAAESIDGLIADIRSRITQAQSENVNRDAIQAEIDQLIAQIDAQVQSANFNGTNLLADDGNPFNVLIGVNGSPNDTLNIPKQNLAVGTTAPADAVASATGFTGVDNVVATVNLSSGNTVADTSGNNTFQQVELTVRDGVGSINDITFTVDLSGADGGDAAATLIEAAIQAKSTNFDGVSVTFDGSANGGAGAFIFDDDDTAGSPATVDTVGFVKADFTFAGGSGGLASLNSINVSSTASQTDLDNALTSIESLADTVRQANATLGSFQNRLDLQTNFVNNLLDSLNKGLGSLVDADLTEESVELNQLQTRQQLGFQTLSIAGQGSQSLLSLFQN